MIEQLDKDEVFMQAAVNIIRTDIKKLVENKERAYKIEDGYAQNPDISPESLPLLQKAVREADTKIDTDIQIVMQALIGEAKNQRVQRKTQIRALRIAHSLVNVLRYSARREVQDPSFDYDEAIGLLIQNEITPVIYKS